MINNFNRRSGSTFIVIIGILAVIFFAATMFMTSTIEEGRQTSMSIRGLHAVSLAEASIERAMYVLSRNANKVSKEDTKNFTADNFGFKLRLPASEGSSSYGTTNLGTDNELNLSELAKEEIVLDKDALQSVDSNKKDLDDLVKYMTDDGAKSYEVTVKVKVNNAFRNSPGSNYKDFKVPGVDIAWNLRYDVKNFLEGKGYTALELKIPSSWEWLSFKIPVKVLGITIVNINITSVLDLIPFPEFMGIKKISDLTKVDKIADIMLNRVIGGLVGNNNIYPVEIHFDKLKMPNSVQDMWPISVTEGDNQYIEKYGQITLECEAKITYKDNYTSARRITAVKDFKVADCEPPAPMYSFFVNNLANSHLSFNNYGGQFIVNNYDYSGTFGKIKEVFTGTANLSNDDIESREFPGLIRVNYLDESGGKNPIVCNVSLIGDSGAPDIESEDDGALKKILKGMEVLVIACAKSKMSIMGNREYTFNCAVDRKKPDSETPVPVDIKGPKKGEKKDFAFGGSISEYDPRWETDSKVKKWRETLGADLNLVPNIGKLSTNVIALAITLAVKPMVEAATGAIAGATGAENITSLFSVPDCFESWEMPYMGNDWRFYTLPDSGTATNKSHLFGYSGMHPTMTKEIEGNVMKCFRQWSMCIVGMSSVDRLPLLPFPPVYLPPVPIPIWKTGKVLKKYAYSAEGFEPNGDDGQVDNNVHEYDPSLIENMAPNLYTNEQYAKKATYYYETPEDFIKDLSNRMIKLGDKNVFLLNGVSYISGSLGSEKAPFKGFNNSEDFYVAGKGMIVCSGNIYLGCNIKTLDQSEKEHTVFTMMCRKGGLIITDPNLKLRFEGSLYTDYGIYLNGKSSLHIVGNWVTNEFNKVAMGGTIVVDYVSSKVRSSLGSLHPTRGKYDPSRYHVSFSPTWASWRAH